MDMIDRLRSEKSAILKRVEDIDHLIAEYEAWEGRVAIVVQGGVSVAVHKAVNDDLPNKSDIRPTPMTEFESAVKITLSKAIKPRDRTELLSDLIGIGVVVGGSDPRNTLSARLSRLSWVVNIKGHGYWLMDRPYEPAGYPPQGEPAQPDFTTPD